LAILDAAKNDMEPGPLDAEGNPTTIPVPWKRFDYGRGKWITDNATGWFDVENRGILSQ